MPAKRFSVEQIVAKLREAESHQAQGLTIPQACKRLGDQRADVLPLADQVRRVEGGRGAAAEGARAGEQPLEEDRCRAGAGHLDAQGPAAGKLVSPARRRDAVRFLVKRRRVSERRACRLVGQHRSTQRYERVPAEYELRLVARMNELAAAHPRWGYRRVWSLLRSEGWRVNRKRIERLWRLEGHRVPPRRSQASGKRAQGTAEKSIWNLPAIRPESRLVVRLHGRPHPRRRPDPDPQRRRRVHPGRGSARGSRARSAPAT